MALDHDFPMASDVWLSALRAAGRSPATISGYRHAVTKLAEWRGDPDVTTVTKFEARRFVQHLTDTYAPGGVANRVRSLKALFGWLVAEEMVEANPFSRIKITIPQEAQTTATDDDIERMLARAKGSGTNACRDLALLTLLCDSGARKGELAALTVADIDLHSGVVRFPISKTVARTVPLTDRAVVALGRYLRARGVGSGSLWSVDAPINSCAR